MTYSESQGSSIETGSLGQHTYILPLRLNSSSSTPDCQTYILNPASGTVHHHIFQPQSCLEACSRSLRTWQTGSQNIVKSIQRVRIFYFVHFSWYIRLTVNPHLLALPEILDKHWEWTIHNRFDSEMMSSKLQGQWMIWMAQWIAPKRGKSQTSILVPRPDLS